VTANRFFIPQPAWIESRLFIEGREHHHLSRVARVRSGETIGLFDDQGGQYQALVEEVGPHRTQVRVISRRETKPPAVAVVLAQALLKLPAMEFIVQKAAEVSLSALAPVISERSVVKIGASPSAHMARWHRIAREAAKQCKTGVVPDIRPPQRLEEFLGGDGSGLKFVLSERGGTFLRDVLLEGLPAPHPDSSSRPPAAPPVQACLLVGPEGGWSAAEEKRIQDFGFRPVSLGRSILRTETAALCAAFWLNHFWNS
jgi:16S rRNA (uracil1498-N3)-methyltransferase